jgi:uncharacterized membrane protein YphA (DoxX/SURF4 family)
MNRNKIIFWVATSFIIFVEGVGNIATANAQYAKEIVYNLGYPEYFRVALLIFKLLGVFAITIPVVPARVKEWAYAGITFNTIFAIISYWAVKGFGTDLIFPVILLSAIVVSYIFYHKLDTDRKNSIVVYSE